jgi:ATP-dependent Lon protease
MQYNMEQRTLLPLFPLGLVILPGEQLPLHIFEERYRDMIADCRAVEEGDAPLPFGISFTEDGHVSEVGCAVELVSIQQEYEDGRLDIAVRGYRRYKLDTIDRSQTYYQGWVSFFRDPDNDTPDDELQERALTLHATLIQKAKGIPPSVAIRDGEALSYALGRGAGLSDADKQTLLEMTNENARLHFLCSFYERNIQDHQDENSAIKRIKANGFLRKLTSADIA